MFALCTLPEHFVYVYTWSLDSRNSRMTPGMMPHTPPPSMLSTVISSPLHGGRCAKSSAICEQAFLFFLRCGSFEGFIYANWWSYLQAKWIIVMRVIMEESWTVHGLSNHPYTQTSRQDIRCIFLKEIFYRLNCISGPLSSSAASAKSVLFFYIPFFFLKLISVQCSIIQLLQLSRH